MNWKEIKGYENIYKVSDEGNVFSIKRNKNLQAGTQVNGYLFVNLSKNGKVKTHRVHRLVAEAFIVNPLSKSDVNHIDSDRKNNMLSNLEWVSRSENLKHCINTRDIIDGENNYKSIFERWQIIIIRYLSENNKYSNKLIKKLLNISYGNLNQILHYKRYKKIKVNTISWEELSGCLYKFFDIQDILVYLDPCGCHSPSLWNYCILQHDKDYFNGFTEEKSRVDVEKIAFTKAFELLEEKLK